ncbi:unnamed protein product [Spirodela intermedia]|uniref:Uncharacterized protein n=1 Tax=Spirodela intermedia TaxID=51605 RepID=A0A7I8KLU9_SPIIN|nr:unnamed protein product [Spirodela intermedia]
MGCVFSCRSGAAFEGVRLVHINGYVEEFPGPVTVDEVTGKAPKLLCFTPAQLLSFSVRPLPDDERLLPGRLYFLLPPTVLQSDTSPVDLAALATRLSAHARSGGDAAAGGAARSRAKSGLLHSDEVGAAPAAGMMAEGGGEDTRGGGAVGGIGGRMTASRARWWKPVLDTIEEKSFRRSLIDEMSVGRSSGGERSPLSRAAAEDASNRSRAAAEDASNRSRAAAEDASNRSRAAAEDASNRSRAAAEDASNGSRAAAEDVSNGGSGT